MIVCKNIVNVNGPWFSQPKKLGTTSVNGSNKAPIFLSFIQKWMQAQCQHL
jgi:hypothetical protein